MVLPFLVEMEEPDNNTHHVDASEPLGENEQPKGLQQTDSTKANQLPSECYPKDVLSSADLLPRDAD